MVARRDVQAAPARGGRARAPVRGVPAPRAGAQAAGTRPSPPARMSYATEIPARPRRCVPQPRPAQSRACVRLLQRRRVGGLDRDARVRLRPGRGHDRRPRRAGPARPGGALRSRCRLARRPAPSGSRPRARLPRADGGNGRDRGGAARGRPAGRRVRLRGCRRDGGDGDASRPGRSDSVARPDAGGADGDERRRRLDRESQPADRAGARRRPARRLGAGRRVRRDGGGHARGRSPRPPDRRPGGRPGAAAPWSRTRSRGYASSRTSPGPGR